MKITLSVVYENAGLSTIDFVMRCFYLLNWTKKKGNLIFPAHTWIERRRHCVIAEPSVWNICILHMYGLYGVSWRKSQPHVAWQSKFHHHPRHYRSQKCVGADHDLAFHLIDPSIVLALDDGSGSSSKPQPIDSDNAYFDDPIRVGAIRFLSPLMVAVTPSSKTFIQIKFVPHASMCSCLIQILVNI